MFIEERHQAILDYIARNGSITTGDIQQTFQISYDSAKRDLRILEEKGLLKRTHGGAIPARQIAQGRPPRMTCCDIKEIRPNYLAIAKRAVEMIQNNDVIYIPSASVGYFMVQNISDTLRLRVVTSNILLAEELRRRENISVIMIGGEMDDIGNCRDSFAVNMIKQLRLDKCFITSACISADFGLSIQSSQAISFWNAVMDSAKTVVGLYPTEKIGFDSVVSICPADRLDYLITDWNASEEDIKRFNEMGIEVIITEKEDH